MSRTLESQSLPLIVQKYFKENLGPRDIYNLSRMANDGDISCEVKREYEKHRTGLFLICGPDSLDFNFKVYLLAINYLAWRMCLE